MSSEVSQLLLEYGRTIHRVKRHIERDNCECCAKATGLSDLKFELEAEEFAEDD